MVAPRFPVFTHRAPRFPVFTHSRWFGALSPTGVLPLELREAHSGAQGLPAVQEAPVLRLLPERGTKMALPGLFHGGRAGRILQSPSLHRSLDPRPADLVHLAGPLLALLDQLHFQRRGCSVTVLRPRAARTWGAGCRAREAERRAQGSRTRRLLSRSSALMGGPGRLPRAGQLGLVSSRHGAAAVPELGGADACTEASRWGSRAGSLWEFLHLRFQVDDF